MANTTKSLSETQIKQAKPRETEYNLCDGRGLTLRIKPSGVKLWLLNYSRPISKTRTNISLGRYPEVSLIEARRKVGLLRGVLSEGVDPQDHIKEKERQAIETHANTFKSVTQKWLKLKKSSLAETTYKKITNRLDRYILPTLGLTPMHKINAVDVTETITPLAEAGKLETVKKLCRWVNEIMVYAVNSGLAQSNPLAGIGKAFNAPKISNLPTILPAELPELMTRLYLANTKIVTRCLIEWQLHTMVRPGEAAGTRWDEIDLVGKVWTIPRERMKMNRLHEVPLTPQALRILETLVPISRHLEFVFPSDHNPRKSANSQSANRAIKRAGFHGRLVSHGLRALASTTLNEEGFDADVIESALAHVDGNSIRSAYNRAKYLVRRREMMEWWSDHIAKASVGALSVSGGSLSLAVPSRHAPNNRELEI